MKKLLALATTALLVLTACSNASETTDTAPKKSGDIVTLASSTDDLSVFVAVLTSAGLVSTLKEVGPFTVFAPNNAAFASLPDGVIEKLLLPKNLDSLVKVLTYHVLDKKVLSAEVKAGSTKTVEGSRVSIATTDGVVINDATVVTADLETGNGVIHVIDRVIVPPSVDLSAL